MIQQLKDRQPEIARLCEEYGVRKLEVFGSAATGDFDPETSDYDFVIDFLDYGPGIADRFIDFAYALEALLGRSVDFAFERKMKPRFRDFIADQREVLFEASSRPVAA
jgi:uncharacterized protein